MFTTVRTLGLVLATAATLAGCNASLPTIGTLTPKGDVVGANTARGKVRVALAGLGKAYQVLATRADVSRLKLKLTSHNGGKVQTRELGPKDLAKPVVYVDFDAVQAGRATLAVNAFDAQGRAIGKGENGTAVAAGKTSTVHVNVKLDPAAGEGQVDAVITFTEGVTPEPTPRDGEEAFRKADRDGDGWLSLKEYTVGWPHAWGGVVIGYPGPEPMPMPFPGDEPVTNGLTPADGGVATNELVRADEAMPAPMPPIRPCYEPAMAQADGQPAGLFAPRCLPPVDEARQDFRRRDVDHDGRLSLAEFLGNVPTSWCDSRFIDLDRDADERLSFNEWQDGQPVPMPAIEPAQVDPATGGAAPAIGVVKPGRPVQEWLYVRFKAMDVNGDGLLDRDEFCNGDGGPIIAY